MVILRPQNHLLPIRLEEVYLLHQLQKLYLPSLLQQQFLSPTFAASSIQLLSGAMSMRDILAIDDFILIVVFQQGYCIRSMQPGCLHGLYRVTRRR